jgi:glycosyltransferase involved in cell wall biosynthesis
MASEAPRLMRPLNILHVLRTPVGGLFRHVIDVTRGQIARGHKVGLVLDSSTGGGGADAVLREIAPSLALGLTRFPMRRAPGLGDLLALRQVKKRIAAVQADVVHGHGAKGGAYARFAARGGLRVYTPHGGSLHYSHDTLSGRIYLGAERLLLARTDLLICESRYSADMFRAKIGVPNGLVRIVHNGVAPAEFQPVAEAAEATDLLFVGELRLLKGVDVLIDAVARFAAQGRRVTATLVGGGPDSARFQAQVDARGLRDLIRLPGAMPARQAFALGRVLVVPSRAESLPYVVLEAAAAGKPVIATRVGGIAEILGPAAGGLVVPDDAAALATAIVRALDRPADTAAAAVALRERVAQAFSLDAMVNGVLAAYREALAARGRQPAFRALR